MLLALPSPPPIMIVLSGWQCCSKSTVRSLGVMRKLDRPHAVSSRAKPYCDVVDFALLCAEVC